MNPNILAVKITEHPRYSRGESFTATDVARELRVTAEEARLAIDILDGQHRLRDYPKDAGARRYAIGDPGKMFKLFKIRRHQRGQRATANVPNEWQLAAWGASRES